MENRKINKSSKLLLWIAVASVLVVAIITTSVLAVTGAWFTDRKSSDVDITTATIGAKVRRNNQDVDTAINPITLSETTNDTNDPIDLLIVNSNPKPITIKSTSNINVYVRVWITLNWEENNSNYENVYDCLNVAIKHNLAVGDTWVPSGSSYFGEWVYYKGVISDNNEHELISSINLASGKSMPSNAKLNVFVEAVQADSIGQARFQDTDTNLASQWNSIFGLNT